MRYDYGMQWVLCKFWLYSLFGYWENEKEKVIFWNFKFLALEILGNGKKKTYGSKFLFFNLPNAWLELEMLN